MEKIFKIKGKERRELKKELFSLKSFAKIYWHYHQLEKDMYNILNINSPDFLMSDEDAKKQFDDTNNKILKIEKDLKEYET